MKLKQYIKYVLVLILLVLLGFLYGFTSKRNQQKKITKVTIEFTGNYTHFLTHKMVDKLLIQKQKSLKNQPKSTLNLYGLEAKVLKNPYVEEAVVYVTIDGELKSIIKQRTPILRIVAKNNSYYVDKQGVYIPLSDSYSARVPLVFGVEKKEDVVKVTELMNVILADNFLKKEIVGIQRFNKNEYQFTVRSGNYKIDFGKLDNVALKFKKLRAFYNKAFLDKTIKQYKTINLKFHNQVVCTK